LDEEPQVCLRLDLWFAHDLFFKLLRMTFSRRWLITFGYDQTECKTAFFRFTLFAWFILLSVTAIFQTAVPADAARRQFA
jgi:hypothetical protein